MPSCARCGQDNPEIARFCLACGSPVAAFAAEREERRVVSVLFVDLVGFTARAETLDPEDVRALLTPYFERVRGEIEAFGGVVEKFIGDAVVGIFVAPVAYGDDPERAVRAALAVRDALADELETRIAVNTGEAIVTLGAQPGHGEAMVAGDVVNTAARLQAAAPANGILVGEETYLSTRTAIRYEPSTPVRAKGKAAPVPAWLAVTPLGPAGERVLSPVPMIGRAGDLDFLHRIWEQVVADRRPHLVTVFGPPGIGKTRLGAEFARLVRSDEGRTLRGRSNPYGASSAYSSFAQQVKQVAGIFDSDERTVALDKLRTVPAGEEDEVVANLAVLIGLELERAARDRDTLFFAAKRFVTELAAAQPTLLVFEDLHWGDPSLLDLVEAVARVRDVPLLLLVLARPELLEHRPTWGGGLPAYSAVTLEPLDDDEARRLAAHLLADRAGEHDPARLAQLAEGNPLFIEELVATVAEGSGGGEALPTNIRSIVAARLDALPAEERSLLLDASVVGKIFWRGALSGRDESLGALLTSLEDRDLIRREAVSRLQGDQQFIFKHVLIRDVAYATVSRARRRERHAEVARFLEDATPDVGDSAAYLGHHWRDAGDDERALGYLLQAAEHAGRGWAKDRAMALYTEALELVPESDEERRREIMRRRALAHQAFFHVPDAQLRRRAEAGG